MSMLAIIVSLLISVVLAAVITTLFSKSRHRDSDDAAQLEYLSRWSDMKRLRKQR